MDGDVREYEYRPKLTMILLCTAFFGVGTVVLGVKAANNDRGVIINGIIELGPRGATAFYWTLTALSGGFVMLAPLVAYHRATFQQRLVVGLATLTVPAGRWSREEKEIAYRDIVALSEWKISGQRLLYITHVGGKHTIAASMLPSKSAFEEMLALLTAKVREAQTAEQRPA